MIDTPGSQPIGELLARLFNSTSDSQVLFRVNEDGDLVTTAANDAYRKSAKSAFGERWFDPVGVERKAYLRQIGIPDSVVEKDNLHYAKALDSGQVLEYETVVQVASPLYFEARIEPIYDTKKQLTHVLWTARDVTDRRAAELEREKIAHHLRESLEEKDTLLREVHHRVKNNLQIIDALLHFQIQQTSSHVGPGPLQDVRARLRAMSLVHDQLYRSDRLSSIDLGEYADDLLRGLTTLRDGQTSVDLDVDLAAGDLQLSIEAAMPCGMILHELVVNAMKHAYPDAEDPVSVKVSLAAQDGAIQLCVADKGIGGTPNQPPPEGFGLRLVRQLVTQLDGTLDYMADKMGTRVTVEIPRS